MARDYKMIFAILKRIGKSKEDAVFEFTEGRTDSLNALNDGEFKEFMIRLRSFQPVPASWKPKPGDAQRKKMIGLAKNMNWGRTTLEVIGKLDEWCIKTFSQKMKDMDLSTLGKAVTIFENKVYTGYLKALKS